MILADTPAGNSFNLEDLIRGKDELIIGRGSEADICLGKGDLDENAKFELRTVSRKHAKLTCTDGIFYLQDDNSANGTRLNGLESKPIDEPIPLKGTENIFLGGYQIAFTAYEQ